MLVWYEMKLFLRKKILIIYIVLLRNMRFRILSPRCFSSGNNPMIHYTFHTFYEEKIACDSLRHF